MITCLDTGMEEPILTRRQLFDRTIETAVPSGRGRGRRGSRGLGCVARVARPPGTFATLFPLQPACP